MSDSNNKAALLQFFDDMYQGNHDAMAAFMDDELVWWTPGGLFAFSGNRSKTEVLEALAGVSGLFPDGLPLKLTSFVEEGDNFAIEAVGDAVTGTGRVYKNVYCFRITMRDGRLLRFHEYMDTGYAQAVMVEDQEHPPVY